MGKIFYVIAIVGVVWLAFGALFYAFPQRKKRIVATMIGTGAVCLFFILLIAWGVIPDDNAPSGSVKDILFLAIFFGGVALVTNGLMLMAQMKQKENEDNCF